MLEVCFIQVTVGILYTQFRVNCAWTMVTEGTCELNWHHKCSYSLYTNEESFDLQKNLMLGNHDFDKNKTTELGGKQKLLFNYLLIISLLKQMNTYQCGNGQNHNTYLI